MFIYSYDTVLLKSYALELTKNEFDYLTELYLTAKRAVTNPVNLIVWVDIDPKRCFDKCLAENTRDHAPPLFFFQMLDNLYRSWLASDSNNVPVVRIDGNVSWDEFNTSVVQFCTTVRKFVDERKNKIFVSQ